MATKNVRTDGNESSSDDSEAGDIRVRTADNTDRRLTTLKGGMLGKIYEIECIKNNASSFLKGLTICLSIFIVICLIIGPMALVFCADVRDYESKIDVWNEQCWITSVSRQSCEECIAYSQSHSRVCTQYVSGIYYSIEAQTNDRHCASSIVSYDSDCDAHDYIMNIHRNAAYTCDIDCSAGVFYFGSRHKEHSEYPIIEIFAAIATIYAYLFVVWLPCLLCNHPRCRYKNVNFQKCLPIGYLLWLLSGVVCFISTLFLFTEHIWMQHY